MEEKLTTIFQSAQRYRRKRLMSDHEQKWRQTAPAEQAAKAMAVRKTGVILLTSRPSQQCQRKAAGVLAVRDVSLAVQTLLQNRQAACWSARFFAAFAWRRRAIVLSRRAAIGAFAESAGTPQSGPTVVARFAAWR
jgi:hypothetical protein